MTDPHPSDFIIYGVTLEGRAFRPSDWAERLAGVMSTFRPPGSAGPDAHIGYSPYCVPRIIDDKAAVFVSGAIRQVEPMAWDFVVGFARDNKLQTADVCLLVEPAP